ncbi:MAG: VTT domain-containing protein [Anaerolineales bacterium]|jgi:membrane protein YqaA with SNARE-associated domain
MSNKQKLTLLRAVALLLAIGISIFIYSIRDQARELIQYGYIGIFLISIIANGTILFPVPGILFVFALGTVYNPLGLAIAAGLGAAIGELTGYLAGFSGQAVIENIAAYEKILNWLDSHTYLSNLGLTLLAAVPNPLFDVVGIAAGTLKIPIMRFLLLVSIGQIIKMFFIAYLGSIGAPFIEQLIGLELHPMS